MFPIEITLNGTNTLVVCLQQTQFKDSQKEYFDSDSDINHCQSIYVLISPNQHIISIHKSVTEANLILSKCEIKGCQIFYYYRDNDKFKLNMDLTNLWFRGFNYQ